MMNNPLADSLRANRKSEPRTTNMKEKASVDVRVDVVHGSGQNIDRLLLLLLLSSISSPSISQTFVALSHSTRFIRPFRKGERGKWKLTDRPGLPRRER